MASMFNSLDTVSIHPGLVLTLFLFSDSNPNLGFHNPGYGLGWILCSANKMVLLLKLD